MRMRRVEQRRRRAAATPSRRTSAPGAGVTPHPIVLGRGETPRRAAVPQGGDAPSPGLWTTGRRAVVLLRQALNDRVCLGRPHPSAPRPRPRRGNARRAGPRRRVARRSGNLGARPSCRGAHLAAGLGRREPGSSAPQRRDQARRATG
jgi:hypothetical protein